MGGGGSGEDGAAVVVGFLGGGMRDGRGLGWSPALDGSEFMSFRKLVYPAFWSDLQWIGGMAGSGRKL